jgi:hydrogenase maturation protein HypF
MNDLQGLKIHITGIVQGVGFRPFVFNLANRLGVRGWVKNTSAGVTLEVDGQKNVLDRFVIALSEEAPVLAKIVDFEMSQIPISNFTQFEIIESEEINSAFQPISPDISICSDCLVELFDPSNRRYRYPFINCTNCGPRFTIINDIPYDRLKTTMAKFPLCLSCSAEYHNPMDRRFHAQPVACKECGPRVWLESSESSVSPGGDPITETQRLLEEGFIVAVKGLGGFHLACDAMNPSAVEKLRQRKLRVDKPFALMVADYQTASIFCQINDLEKSLLESSARPIVLLHRMPGCPLPQTLAPGQDTLGIMLPYTPLHYLLFSKAEGSPSDIPQVLVMTSGNLSEEPIAIENQDAKERLSSLADFFLFHDRNIRTRCDDSVMRISTIDRKTIPIRRSRGYVPIPIITKWNLPPSLAAGTELKNTFCLTRGQYAFMSHHIGDMENLETLQSFKNGIDHFERLFKIQPELIACDLHPNYLATRYAENRSTREQIPLAKIQHHHAHIASCMAENEISSNTSVIGIAFDGTGFGPDEAIWGGEFLIADYKDFHRFAHLQYVPLPGGDAAIRNPARTALAYLSKAGIDWMSTPPVDHELSSKEKETLRFQLSKRINTPLTSSMGRLFDAVAAIIGLRLKTNYEAQAAIELEAIADTHETGIYPFTFIQTEDDGVLIDPSPLIKAVLEDYLTSTPLPLISARFHNSIVEMVKQVAMTIRNFTDLNTVALSGGVWQNTFLLSRTVQNLRNLNFDVKFHSLVPPNDAGIALGQAIVAYHQLAY